MYCGTCSLLMGYGTVFYLISSGTQSTREREKVLKLFLKLTLGVTVLICVACVSVVLYH